MSELDPVALVHTSSVDLPHETWITKVTAQNSEYISTTNMGRFSATTRYGVGPANRTIRLVMEGDEDFQTRLDLGATRGGYWAIKRAHRNTRRNLDRRIHG